MRACTVVDLLCALVYCDNTMQNAAKKSHLKLTASKDLDLVHDLCINNNLFFNFSKFLLCYYTKFDCKYTINSYTIHLSSNPGQFIVGHINPQYPRLHCGDLFVKGYYLA